MPFVKGKSGNPNGRIKGTQNKITKTIREVVLETFLAREKNPRKSLAAFANKNPTVFYTIASRLIPTEISATLAGKLEITTPSWFDNATYNLLPGQALKETADN